MNSFFRMGFSRSTPARATTWRQPSLHWLLSLFLAAITPAAALDVLDLHNLPGWQLNNQAGFANVSLRNVELPAAALQLLHQAGIVGDPLYRYRCSTVQKGRLHFLSIYRMRQGQTAGQGARPAACHLGVLSGGARR